MRTTLGLTFGRNAKYTNFGLLGCAHGMYSGGYNYYVYGIAYIINFTIDRSWGSYSKY